MKNLSEYIIEARRLGDLKGKRVEKIEVETPEHGINLNIYGPLGELVNTKLPWEDITKHEKYELFDILINNTKNKRIIITTDTPKNKAVTIKIYRKKKTLWWYEVVNNNGYTALQGGIDPIKTMDDWCDFLDWLVAEFDKKYNK